MKIVLRKVLSYDQMGKAFCMPMFYQFSFFPFLSLFLFETERESVCVCVRARVREQGWDGGRERGS